VRRDEHSDRRIVGQYVSAIMAFAADDDSWERWDRDLSILSQMGKHPSVRNLLSRARIDVRDNLGEFRKLGEGLLSEFGVGLGELTLEDGCFDLLPRIYSQFVRRSEIEGPVDRVTVRTASTLVGAEIDKLRDVMQRPGRRMIFTQEEDSSIIGGLVLRQGDWRRDFSVAARLQTLRRTLYPGRQ